MVRLAKGGCLLGMVEAENREGKGDGLLDLGVELQGVVDARNREGTGGRERERQRESTLK